MNFIMRSPAYVTWRREGVQLLLPTASYCCSAGPPCFVLLHLESQCPRRCELSGPSETPCNHCAVEQPLWGLQHTHPHNELNQRMGRCLSSNLMLYQRFLRFKSETKVPKPCPLFGQMTNVFVQGVLDGILSDLVSCFWISKTL